MKLLLLADEPNLRLWDHLDRKLLDGVDLVAVVRRFTGELSVFFDLLYGCADSLCARKSRYGLR